MRPSFLRETTQEKEPTQRHVTLRGNTLAEYGLAATLVLVLALGAILVLSGDLNKALAALKNEMSRQNAQAAANNSASLINGSSFGKPAAMTLAQQSSLQDELATKLQTTGANGATKLLADQIARTAELMLKEGKINQAQYDVLMRLANQGHQMAKIQGMIEEAVVRAGGDYQKFANMSFNIDGKAYTAAELSNMIGFYGPTPFDLGSQDLLTLAQSNEPVSDGFLNLYKEALASGALSDPAIKSTVNSASTQILQMGEVTENQMSGYYHGWEKPANVDEFRATQAEQSTHMSSGQICTAGDFEDNGTICAP